MPRYKTEVTPNQAIIREQEALDHKERSTTKVIREWVEIKKRYAQEDGKVILKRQKDSGYTTFHYIGRESQCKEYLKKAQAAGKYSPFKGE